MEDFNLQLSAELDKQKSIQQLNRDIQQIEKSINKIKLLGTFIQGETKNELNQYINRLSGNLDYVKLKAKLDEKSLNQEIQKTLNNLSYKDIDLLNVDGSKAMLKVQKIVGDVKSYASRNPITFDVEFKRAKLSNDLTSYINKNSKINESSVLLQKAEELRTLNNNINDKTSLKQATDQFQLFKSEVTATGFATKSTSDKIKNMRSNVTKIGSIFGLASTMVNKYSQSLGNLKEIDTILTEISKTSDMTEKQLKELGNTSFETANKYGQLSANYLEGVREMARSGYTNSKELGELSVLAQSAGDMSAEMANNFLLATDAAYEYKGSISSLTSVLDGANYISNRNSVSLSDLADGIRVSASYAAGAGVAIEELTAAEGTMSAVTKRSGSEMGRAFRSILLNLQQVSGEFDGEIIDEDQLKKVEARCHSLGVELEYMQDGIATLRNPMEILKELSEVYNSLPDNSADKQGLISDLGGKYHANALSSLLKRWDLYEKMLSDYSNGSNSAIIEAEKTADSWEGRLNQLQNTWDSFVNSITSKDMLKGGITSLDTVIQGAEKLVNTIGVLPVAISAINGSLTGLNKNYGITQLINPETKNVDIQGNLFGVDFTAIKAQKEHFDEAATSIEKWNGKLSQGTTDINDFEDSLVKNNVQLKDYLATTSQQAPASLSGYKAHLNAAGVSTDALRLKTLLLNSAIGLGIGAALQISMVALKGLVSVVDNYVHRVDNAKEQLSGLKSNFTTLTSEIESLSSELDNNMSKIDALNSREKLTYAEKGELEKLQEITKELQRQLDIKQKAAEREATKLSEQNRKTFDLEFNDDSFSTDDVLNLKDRYTGDTAHLALAQEGLEGIAAALLKMKDANKEAVKSKNTDWIEGTEEGIQHYKEQLESNLDTLQGYRDNLTEIMNYRDLTKSEKAFYDNLEQGMKLIYTYTDPNAWNAIEIKDILNTDGIEITKEALTELAKTGKLDENTIKGYTNLNSALSDSNLILEEGQTAAQALCNELYAIAEAEGEVEINIPDTRAQLSAMSKRVYGDSDDNVAGLVDEYELLKEVLSDTGNISQKTYENLLSCSQKYSTAIVKENGRITLNTAKLKAVAKSRAIDTKAAIQETLALKRQQWIMWANNIAVYKDQTLESVMANYDNIDSLQAEISQYALLEQQLDNTAGAFESFKNAQASENQSMYDTAQDAFNVLNDTLNNADSDLYGKFNSDDFQEAFMLLADTTTFKEALNAQDLEQYQRVVGSFINEIKPLFDENNAKSANHLFEEVNKLVEAGNVPVSDRDWADTLGISTDAFNALKELANLYDFKNKDVFESYDLNKLTEYQTLLSNVKAEEAALGEVADKTSTHYLNQSHSLDVAKEKLQSFLDENKNVVTELFKEYKEQDLADAGTTFSDYIKKSLEYDEDDLDATIQALYEKYQDIGSTLTNKDKLMDSAKYGEYEQTARLIEALGSSIDELKGKKQEETQETENNNQKLDESSQKLGEAKINADNYSTSLDSVKTSMDDVNSAVSDFGASSLENASRKASELAGNLSSVADLLSWITTDKTEDTQSDFGKKSFDEYLAKPQSTTGKDTQGSETTVTAKLDASDVESYDAPDKDMPVVAALDSSAADGYTPPTKTMQVNVKVNSSGLTLPTLDATTATVADGTFNAFADGSRNVSVTHKQNALVNELGEEGLVRNGKLIPIKGGARFIGLKRGDIIFNHRQMKELKKNGHTTGRGRLIGSAYADGTVNAYAGGTSYKGNGSGTKVNIPNLIDVKDNNNAIKDAKNASKSISDAIDNTVDDAKDATEEIFDWIERRVKKFQRLFDKWLNQAETAITSNFITKYFKKATSNLKNELNTYGKSYSRYMKEANSVGLSEKYAKKVRNGTIDISTITDEDLADQISKYQEYYDKAIDATTSFVETAEKLYNLPLDKAAAKIERFEDAIDLLDAKLDNATTAGSKNKLLDQQVKQQKAILDANKTSLKETKSNLKSTGKDLTKSSTLKNSGVTSKEKKAIKKAVKSGKEVDLSYFKEGSSGYNAAVKYNEALKAQKEAQQEASLASEEYTSLIRENAKEKLDNIKEEYESNIQLKNSYIDTAKSVMSLKEAQGKKISASDFNSIITNTKDISNKAKAEYNAYLAQYNKNLKSGIYKGDAQAQREALSQLEELKAAWYEAQSCVEQYIDAQNQIKIDNINDLITSLEKLQNKYEKLLSLRKTQGLDTTDDEILKRIDSNNKQITQKALLLQEYQKQLQIAQANGADADIQKYNDLIADTETSILDLKIANEELNDSIYDIRIDALNKEKEALQKLNDQEDRRRKLGDAKAAKEKANQRTDLVYDGKQFIYKRNEQTYKDAVDALRDLEFEELIHAIEDNVNILEELKNKYNLYDSNGNALNQGSIINAVTESADKIYDSVQAVVNSNNYVYDKETGKLGNIILTKYGKFTRIFTDDVPINQNVSSTINPEFLKALQDFNNTSTDKILENATFVRPNFDFPESKEISNVVNNTVNIGDIYVSGIDNAEQLAKEIESKLPNEIIKRIYNV